MAADGKITYKIDYDTRDAESKVSNLGKSIAGLAAIGIGIAITKSIIEVGSAAESSFAKVKTLLIGTDVETEKLSASIRELSSESGIATTELSEGLYQAISAGVPITNNGAEAIEFLETNIKLAKGGFTDLTSAVDATTSVINAYGKDVGDVNDVANVFIKTQNAGKTTVDELASVISNVTPLANNLGVSFEQVGASFATVTAAGVSTAQTATQLKALFTEFSKSGSKVNKTLREMTGKNFKQFISAGGTVGEALSVINDEAKASNLELTDFFTSIESANAAAIMASEQGLSKFNASLESINDTTDAVTAAANIMDDTFEARVAKIQNELSLIGQEIFILVEPFLSSAANKLIDFLRDLRKEGFIKATLQLTLDIVEKIGGAAGKQAVRERLKTVKEEGLGEAIIESGQDLLQLSEQFSQRADTFGERLVANLTGVAGVITGLVGGGIKGIGNIFGFADGGIVTGPTLGLIGEGTESEVVMPLSQLENFVNTNAGQSSIIHNTIVLNGQQLANVLTPEISEHIRLVGGSN